VLVVDAQGKVAPRQVKVNGQQAGSWIVGEGLKAGEQVVVDGTMKLQMLPPGTPVKPVPWNNGAPAAPGAKPASAPASGAKPAGSAAKS